MDAILDLLRVIYEPGAVFERVREKPKILAPLGVLMLAAAMVQLVQLPYVRAAIAPMLAAIAQQNPKAVEMASLRKSNPDFHRLLEISHRPRDSHIPTAGRRHAGREKVLPM